jgi:ribosomal protein L11 methyltransferase
MRSKKPVSQLSIVTSHEGEEPIAALLERVFGVTPVIYTNVEKGHSVVTLYAPMSMAELRVRQSDLTNGFDQLRDLGLQLGSVETLIRKVPREDWSESWKKYFKTIAIGSSLLIKPSWSKQKAKPGQASVVLDPGLSFGTGQHATTAFCLRQIATTSRRSKKALSLLDAGCGSGILAISAAKLGYSLVTAFDFDPVAVRIARKNCRTNRVHDRVTVSRKDLTRISLESRIRHDVICANLMSDLLISERDKLVNRLAPGGTMVLAGILESEFQKVRSKYEQAGLRLIRTKVEREWQSGAFTLQAER